MNQPPQLWFVSGTDTEIGKTYCTAAIARWLLRKGQRVGVYKPVASGCSPDENGDLVAEDAIRLWNAAGRPGSLNAVCPQRFQAPLAPPQAAAQASSSVDAVGLVTNAQAWLTDEFDTVLVEGAGGLFSPIAEEMLNADLVVKMRPARVFLVAPNRLGVISSVIANYRAALASAVPISDVILNDIPETHDASMEWNAAEIERCLSMETGATPRLHRMGENGSPDFFLPR